MPDMIATKSLPYAGKRHNIGDRFEAGARDARLLIAVRKARYATAADERKAMQAEEPAPAIASTYLRRDIAAAPEIKSDAPRARGRRASQAAK